MQTRNHGLTVWLTGLSSAGKTTIAMCLARRLGDRGCRVAVLDGDVVREGLSKGLGFSKEDRDEHVRRIGHEARHLTGDGVVVLVAAISPYRAARDAVRRTIGNFIEVHVDAPLAICEQRDPKGLYRRARRGEVTDVSGIDAPYEAPLQAEVTCSTAQETVDESVRRVLVAIEARMDVRSAVTR